MASPTLRQIITLVALSSSLAHAQSATLCRIRPDLCKKKLPNSTHQDPAPHCREPNKAYNLEQSNLPVCKAKVTAKAEKKINPKAKPKLKNDEDDSLFAEFENAPAEIKKTSVPRHPASSNSNFSFDAYMTANAGHPALNNRVRDHQNAFVDTAQPAVIAFPGEGSSIKEGDPVPPPAAPSAASPSSSSAGSAAAATPNGVPFR